MNIHGQRTVLRVFCPNCRSECGIEVHEFCKCDVIIECEICGSKECQCVFDLLEGKQFKGRVKKEKVFGKETLREIYLTVPRNRKTKEEKTLC